MYIWILTISDDFCLFPAQCCYVIIYVKNFESQVQFVDQCAPVKVANSAVKSVLQKLHFQVVGVHCILLGGAGINHYWTNKFSINALMLTFE
jgi:hypothetical protein